MLEFIDLTTISIALMIIGAIGVVLLKKPLDKVIMVSILEAGLFLAIVSFKYFAFSRKECPALFITDTV